LKPKHWLAILIVIILIYYGITAPNTLFVLLMIVALFGFMITFTWKVAGPIMKLIIKFFKN